MLILYAPRFKDTALLADLRAALGADGAPCDALMGRGGELRAAKQRLFANDERVLLLGLPRRALLLAARLGPRATLALDLDAGFLTETLARLKGLRIACFSFAIYTRLRRLGADAAFFAYAPAPPDSATEDGPTLEFEAAPIIALRAFLNRLQHYFCADRETRDESARLYYAAHGGLDGGFLAAMTKGARVIAPARDLFPQYLTHGVSGRLLGRAPLCDAAVARLGAGAKRVALLARRRFIEDRERLRAFVAGGWIEPRTVARVDWPAPPAGANPGPQAREGGRRLSGRAADAAGDAPLITVAIVLRNAKDSFARTLASVTAQDYPNLEIIVVDGDSTDGTREEVAARGDLLDYWISERDSGPYDGMNKAARLARGRFLIFMNAGDFFAHASAISEAFETQEARAADIVIGHHVFVDANGVEQLCKNGDFDWLFGCVASGALCWDWHNGMPCGQAVFLDPALLRERPFDTCLRIAADHDFLYAMRAAGRRFFHCDSIIGVYTSGGLSGVSEQRTARELHLVARRYGPPAVVDAWFRKNMPIAFK